MKRTLVATLLAAGTTFGLSAQTTKDYTIRVTASVQSSPAKIILSWPADAGATKFSIWRKLKSETTWKSVKDSLPGTAITWTDDQVAAGNAYEYRFFKKGNVSGNGYIYAGIELPLTHYRGTVVLLVDETMATPLAAEIERLKKDMLGDGWRIISHNVSRTAAVTDVRSLIVNDYQNQPGKVQAVFILGHVPVPYSGNFAIDGHNPDHKGAWPADICYADVDNYDLWTDNIVDNSQATRPANHNVPSDGKYDNDVFPGELELQVGRVDLSNLPAFGISETELLRRYLDKDHAFRTRKYAVQERAIIDDNWGAAGGEAFGASAFQGFSTMFGADSVKEADYRTSVRTGSYLWAYGGGPGSYSSAAGVATTAQLAADSLQAVFHSFFGSYFGDWDSQDNFLRAPLAAKGFGLTNVWSGRPQWILHHMALGGTIGYSAWLSQNNYKTYYRSTFLGPEDRLTTPALMGDPTLRLHIVAPPTDLDLTENGEHEAVLTWQSSADNVLGYHVYRMNERDGEWVCLNTELISDNKYTDQNAKGGHNLYMVRAVVLQQTASGSYFNASTGALDSIYIQRTGIAETSRAAQHTINVFPNPAGSYAQLEWNGVKSAANGKVKVYDITGREVFCREVSRLNQDQFIRLELESVPAGVYTVRLQAGSNVYSARVVKE